MEKRFAHKVDLYQKKYIADDILGRSIAWVPLGDLWVTIEPYKVNYPLEKEGQKKPRGRAYELIMYHDDRLFQTDKIVWEQKDYFLMSSPQRLKTHYLKIRVFSWEESL